MQAKVDGCPVERATVCQILHTHKDGYAINTVVQEKW